MVVCVVSDISWVTTFGGLDVGSVLQDSGVPFYDLIHSTLVKSPGYNARHLADWNEPRGRYPRSRFRLSLEILVDLPSR